MWCWFYKQHHEHSPPEANHLLTPADCPVKYRLFQDIKCHHDWVEEISNLRVCVCVCVCVCVLNFFIFHTTSIKIRIVDPDLSLSLSREGNAYCHTFSELDVYIIWICDLNFNNQALKRF